MPEPTYELEVTRFIRAPRAKVFAAFLDKHSEVMKHFAPDAPDGHMRMVFHELEPHVGGRIRYTMAPAGAAGDEGGPHMVSGRNVEIVADERIVQSQEGPGGPSTTVTYRFEDAEGGTQVTIRQEGLPDARWADGAKHGWGSALENLAAAWEATLEA